MEEIRVEVRKSSMVRPSQDTPKRSVWMSNLDVTAINAHVRCVYFYRPNGSPDFFDLNPVKEALSRALVEFYPFAGRFREGENGRVEIECSGEGVLLVEAETASFMDDLGDFVPGGELVKLVPKVDASEGISTYPLLLLQLTYFRCGGVSLGVGVHHRVSDAHSFIHFINTWAGLARGHDAITTPPFIDRTLLRAPESPQPLFDHIEYQPPSSLKNVTPIRESNHEDLKIAVFKITRAQIDTLRVQSKQSATKYSTYELLAGHIWRNVCKARGLPKDQQVKLKIATDGRQRLEPPLPNGFFGNAVFFATPVAEAEDLVSKPTLYAASKIHEALVRMDNEYLRSALDYLELHPNMNQRALGTLRSSNLGINSWARFPIYEADFDWGRPINVRPGSIPFDGQAFLLPTRENDGSQTLALCLQAEHMKLFSNYLNEI